MSVKISDHYVPPFTRKKRVIPGINPNTYRVLFEDAYFAKPRPGLPLLAHADHLTPSHPIPPANHFPRPSKDLRHANPSPSHCRFLLSNVATLNNAIPFVDTHNTKDQQEQWWKNDVGKVSSSKPVFSCDSTTRQDYRKWDGTSGATRHSSNPNKNPALGVVPVTQLKERDDSVRVWRERISYEHDYNSRDDPNYPIRGKRHGRFIWSRYPQNTLEDIERFETSKEQTLKRIQSQMSHNDLQWTLEECDRMPKIAYKEDDCLNRPIPKGRFAHSRQFIRVPREDSVAALIQPEFEYYWNRPSTPPQFTT